MLEDVITLDGPSSSGKNSVGFLLARQLGYKYIDSGMIYRAGAYKILKKKIDPHDLEKVLEEFRNLNIRFENNNDWLVYLNDEDVTDKLHTPEVSSLVYLVAAIPQVREITRGFQRKLAEEGKVIIGGRDIGSEIFPDSKHKFFLTASVEVRAKRRFKQLSQKDSQIKYEDVLNDMRERDKYDSEREASPMRIPKGAIVIDSSDLNLEQVVDKILKVIHA